MKLQNTLLILMMAIMASCSTESIEQTETLFENETTEVEEVALTMTASENALFDLVNDYRDNLGLSKLDFSGEALKYAKGHNEYMIKAGELSHANFSDRASKLAKETQATFVAENVAKNYPKIEMALEGWIESPAHQKTLVGDFTHTGISITEDAQGNAYYTQIFYKK
ncbi:MAG: CAP domain-containing protein [Croceitalea sp.]|nr:CAP domain-containing protein [Croceitalea sp.]MBT8237391.1 CAP domain-containing protein [Croceitalea sp.]NNC35163.1 CAP domain-containing protein [Croceitalea sp.]NNL09461.1 CAP domain-containing protein [Croceitalea sp.]NNM17953.1 CAP domain-containing protein [Croceitalea sp.]